MYIAKNIKHLRKKERRSQREFAESLGITRSRVSSYEDGRAEPPLSMLIIIADYYSITLDELVRVDLEECFEANRTDEGKARQTAWLNMFERNVLNLINKSKNALCA